MITAFAGKALMSFVVGYLMGLAYRSARQFLEKTFNG